MAELKIPFGRAKGKVLSECTDAEIQWAIDAIAKKLEDDPEKPYADKDRGWLTGARKVLDARKGGGGPSKAITKPAVTPPAATALAKVAPGALSLEKLTHDPAAITARLGELAANYHMVTPAAQVDALPEGFGVAISLVHVNPDSKTDGPGEVYSVGGSKVGISGFKLLEIGSAAGVDWLPRESGRLDDGSDPHYCHYRAVGVVRNFDGSERTIMGEVEIDARDGSPQIDEIITKAKAGDRDPAKQILELRKFLLRHAETKAKCRAIASMGVKRSYGPAELAKPFAVARLMFTGHSADPELRRQFAVMNAEHAIKGRSALYGQSAPALPQRPAPLPEFHGHAPPPVGGAPSETEYDYGDLGDIETTAEAAPKSEPKAQPAPATPAREQLTLPADQDRGPNPERY